MTVGESNPPPPAPARPWYRRRGVVVPLVAAIAIVALVGAVFGVMAVRAAGERAAVEAAAEKAAADAAAQAEAEAKAEAERKAAEEKRKADAAAAAEREKREKDGQFNFTTSCDYLLNFDAGHTFVADAFLTYEGSTPITVKITASWLQSGGEPVTQTKDVALAEGDTDIHVTFAADASSSQIDAIQALPFDKQCTVTTDGTPVP